ncbi:hypothetical protein [Kitasatospora cineracea]|uniref:DUF3558 domain-containing protein n=1 Tax=Kitasatospora cineracea TaxID=88074 RepID=A0A3N4S207_9ACTN|nr:hypothetical protein [Kitasatospora cineracea]ROR46791.1 hypothetical protein EDD39_5082 [Kitasatospora cineracea]RPE36955.1 hypothetical protein EDD38_5336 [Kitasatospora cineracea]
MRLRRTAALLLLPLLVTVGCGSAATPAAAPPPASPSAAAPSSGAPDRPSDATSMICNPYFRQELAGALGTDTTQPLAPTWEKRVYSCEYHYPDGSMTLSVKELPDAATALAQYDGLRGSAGAVTDLNGLGEAAYKRADGTTVVRKDAFVLTVDVAKLPETFGTPPRSRADVAVMTATTVMICWKEHSS